MCFWRPFFLVFNKSNDTLHLRDCMRHLFVFISFYVTKILTTWIGSILYYLTTVLECGFFQRVCVLFNLTHFFFHGKYGMRNMKHRERIITVFRSVCNFHHEAIYCTNVCRMIRLRKWNVCYVCLKLNIQYRINQLIQNLDSTMAMKRWRIWRHSNARYHVIIQLFQNIYRCRWCY